MTQQAIGKGTRCPVGARGVGNPSTLTCHCQTTQQSPSSRHLGLAGRHLSARRRATRHNDTSHRKIRCKRLVRVHLKFPPTPPDQRPSPVGRGESHLSPGGGYLSRSHTGARTMTQLGIVAELFRASPTVSPTVSPRASIGLLDEGIHIMNTVPIQCRWAAASCRRNASKTTIWARQTAPFTSRHLRSHSNQILDK